MNVAATVVIIVGVIAVAAAVVAAAAVFTRAEGDRRITNEEITRAHPSPSLTRIGSVDCVCGHPRAVLRAPEGTRVYVATCTRNPGHPVAPNDDTPHPTP